MKIIEQEAEINRIRLQRRELEVDVAKAIAESLLKNDRLYYTRLARQILLLIDETATAIPEKMNSLLSKQTSFMMWSECNAQPSLYGLRRVGHYLESGAGEPIKWLCVCSDLIRLFGELSEKAETKTAPLTPKSQDQWKILDSDKGKLRPGPVFAKPTEYKGAVVKTTSPDGWGHRDRYDAPQPTTVAQPFVDIPREKVAWRGVEKFRFGTDSVIQTIDWTYGLAIEGADVSGTTTDSIAALRWCAAANGESSVNSWAQLIAIATMVSQGHHTIVECGWPLTRHGYMDYKIGFYETLVTSKKENEGLYNVLVKFNDDRRNNHVIVCTMNGKTRGLHFDKTNEKDEYRKIAGIRQAYSFCVAGKQDSVAIKNFLKANHLDTGIINQIP